MKITPFALFALFTILSICSSAQNTAGMLDATFNGNGKVVYNNDQFDLYQDIQVQADGKFVATGTSMNSSYVSRIVVNRYNADGTIDASFGNEGQFTYSTNIECGSYKCIIKEDGKILLGGYSTDYVNYGILMIQLNANGTLDPSFGNLGIVYADLGPGEDMISAMTMQEDGKILVAGYSQDINFRNAPYVARFSETGILDTSFGNNGIASVPVTETDNEFSAVSIQSDGKIVAAGHISNGLSWFSLLAARFDANGNLDPSYGTDGVVNMNLNNVDDEFFDMKLTENDEAVLTGFTVTPSDFYYHLLIMKLDITGQPVNSFGNLGKVIYGEVPYTFGDAMMLQTDGKIVVAGCTGQLLPGNNDWALWRFNPNGSLDESFGTLGVTTTDFFENADEALGLALFEDKILLAGKTRNADNWLDFAVARYTNDIQYHLSVPAIAAQENTSITPNPVKRNSKFNIDVECPENGIMSVELLGMDGRLVKQWQPQVVSVGKQSLPFSLPASLQPGVYVLKLKTNLNQEKTQKLVIAD